MSPLSFASECLPDFVNLYRVGAYLLGLLRNGKKVETLHSSAPRLHAGFQSWKTSNSDKETSSNNKRNSRFEGSLIILSFDPHRNCLGDRS